MDLQYCRHCTNPDFNLPLPLPEQNRKVLELSHLRHFSPILERHPTLFWLRATASGLQLLILSPTTSQLFENWAEDFSLMRQTVPHLQKAGARLWSPTPDPLYPLAAKVLSIKVNHYALFLLKFDIQLSNSIFQYPCISRKVGGCDPLQLLFSYRGYLLFKRQGQFRTLEGSAD